MADYWDKYFAREQGQVNAAPPAPQQDTSNDAGYLGGFIASTASGFSELFGDKPTPTAQSFRNRNPVSGFVSSAIGGVAPYAVVGELSLTARGTQLLDTAMEAIPGVRALSAAETPVRYGMAREMLRYSPVELGRLGIGLTQVDDSRDYGNLFADVGLTTLITGGFGGIGGFFRAGGKVAPEMGRVVGSDYALKPTFALRMARGENAQVTGDLPLGDVQNQLMREVFTERVGDAPIQGVRPQYVNGLEGGSPETDALVNTLFRPSGGRAGSLIRKPLMTKEGAWTLDEPAQQELLGGLGMQDMHELGESAVYPRLITINSQRAAGTLAKVLDDSPALQFVSDGVMMAREANSGLFMVAKRLKSGAADPLEGATDAMRTAAADLSGDVTARFPDATHTVTDAFGEVNAVKAHGPSSVPGQIDITFQNGAIGSVPQEMLRPLPRKVIGSTRIAEGDQWFIGLTDQPQRFVPDAHKVADLNVAQWAKYRDPYRPSDSPDIFNQQANLLNDVFTPGDFRDLKVTTRNSFVGRMTEKLSDKFGNVTGLKGSETFQRMANALYDVVKPTAFLENQSPLFQRLFAHLRNNMRAADEVVNRVMGGEIKVVGSPAFKRNVQYGEGFAGGRPLQQIWRDLSDDERQLVVKAANTQTPGEDLAKLTSDGLISHKAAEAITELQAINQNVWDQVLLPAFKAGGLDAKYNLLEGYILPRLFKGDWFVPVLDEGGNTMWLSSGTLGGAKAEAATVAEEATKKGLKWSVGEARATHVSEKSVADIQHVSELVGMQMGKSAETQDIIQSAMKRLEMARMSGKKGGALPDYGSPKTLAKDRTGLPGTPDAQHYTIEDVLKASEDHYKQLLRFAGYHTWRERWLPEAFNLSKLDPTLYANLQRKANQFMGIEGQITNQLNKALSPLLGGTLGGKAATRIAQGTNHLMYAWNLGIANPTFALLNLMNPLQTVAPWIAAVTKMPTLEAEKLMHVGLRFGEDGRVAGQLSMWHPMKVLGQSLKEIRNPDEQLMAAFSRAKTDGTLTPQLYEGWVGGTSRAKQTLRDAYTQAGGGAAGGWEFIKRTATLLGEKSEEFSRINAFAAAHILGRDHFGLEGEALYKFAQRGTHVTMYGYNIVDRSRMFTGPIGSMFGLFKNWQFHFIGQMAQYAGLGIREGIWAPLVWQGASALALGGLGATPLVMLANGLAKWQSNSPNSFLWLQEHWHNSADEIYYGLPALLGASLQASATVPGTDVRNDLATLGNFVFIERAKAAAKAVGDAYNLWDGAGTNPLRDGNTRDKLLQAFAPRAVFRAFASTEGDYVKSMTTGYPNVRGLSPADKFLYAMGVNQVDVERQQTAARLLYLDQQTERAHIDALGTAFADAEGRADRDTMTDVINRALAMKVPVSSVVKSANTRNRREQTGDSMSRFDHASVARYMDALKR